MKTLYLLRHAKASWDEDVDDHGRSLKKRGIKDAHAVANEILTKLKLPQKIFASDAKRTNETAQIFKEVWKIEDANFSLEPLLYDFQGGQVLKFIKLMDNNLDRVMIVGHNYAITALANMFGNKKIDEVPTCGFVMLNFEVSDWNSVLKGKTGMHVFPKQLKL